MVELIIASMHEHATFPKTQMAAAAVLSMLVISPEGKERAVIAGAVAVLFDALQRHSLHNGVRAWVCGCLSNVLMHEPAKIEFDDLRGIDVLAGFIRVSAASVMMPIKTCCSS